MSSWDDLCWNPNEEFLNQGRQEGHDMGLRAGYQDGLRLGRIKAIEFGMEVGFVRGFLRHCLHCHSHVWVETNDNDCKRSHSDGNYETSQLTTIRRNHSNQSTQSSLSSSSTPSSSAFMTSPIMRQKSTNNAKLLKNIQELVRLVDDFPNPDQMFHRQNNRTILNDTSANEHVIITTHHEHEGSSNDDPETIEKFDDYYTKDNANASTSQDKVDLLGKLQMIRVKFKLLAKQMGLSPHITFKTVLTKARQEQISNLQQTANSSTTTTPVEAFDVSDW